jgi:hypothetical protein
MFLKKKENRILTTGKASYLSYVWEFIHVFTIPALALIVSYFAFQSMEESNAKSIELAKKTQEDTVALMRATLEVAVDTHRESLGKTIKHHAANIAITREALAVSADSHNENMKQAVKQHEQGLRENYNNLVHEQNRERYYETLLMVSKSIPHLQKKLDFCNDYYYEIQQVYSREEEEYKNSLYLLGEDFITKRVNKKTTLSREDATTLATEELKDEYNWLKRSKLMSLKQHNLDRIRQSEEFKSHLNIVRQNKRFYEYVDEESHLWLFVQNRLSDESYMNFKSEINNKTPKEAKLVLENKFAELHKRDELYERIYVNYKQLGGSLFSLADLFLFSEFNHFTEKALYPDIKDYYVYEDLSYSSPKNIFKSNAEVALFEYYSLVVWNLLVSQSTFEYMRNTSYESHIENEQPIVSILSSMSNKLEMKHNDQRFFVYRCESAYSKATQSMSKGLSVFLKRINDKGKFEENFISNYLNSLSRFLTFDQKDIERKLQSFDTVGPDSMDE